ncbi:ABC transporter permease [Entomoplasma freundtii]|nr:ABC transporter permease [Entomoplasma freundtii]
MKLKLVLKQSFRDFTSKSILYLTFTLFLMLAISIFVGLISFGYGFQNLFRQTVGATNPNASLNFNRAYLPYWITAKEAKKDTNGYYKAQERDALITEFLKNLLPIPDGSEFQRLTLGIGHSRGDVTKLHRNEIFNDALLYDYFQQDSGLDQNLAIYNNQVQKIYEILDHEYQTNNLVSAYFMEKEVKENKNLLGYQRAVFDNDFVIESLGKQPMRWEYLRVNPKILGQDFYEETPWTLHENKASTIKFWQQVDWTKHQKERKNYNFIFVQPAFLHSKKLNIGDYVTLEVKNIDKFKKLPPNVKTQEFLIAGTATDSSNFYYSDNKPNFMIPYQWMANFYKINGVSQIPPPTIKRTLLLYLNEFGNDYQRGQDYISKVYNRRFRNLVNVRIIMESSTSWVSSLPRYAYDFTVQIFITIAYVVGFLVLFLLGVVFYFITQQVVMIQRRILFFLKAMGVYDSGLSFITTAALFVPILLGLIAGFFGALLVQKTMYSVALLDTAFYMPYFSFNYEFFLFLFGLSLVIWLLFFLINTILIKSSRFRMAQQINVHKTATLFQKLKFKLTKNASSKFRIGFSFAFKNIYKNFIVFITLSLSFGVILYAVQFKVSMSTLSRSYESWNKPYKSVNYMTNLPLFSQEPAADNYLLSYETFIPKSMTNSQSDLNPKAVKPSIKTQVNERLEAIDLTTKELMGPSWQINTDADLQNLISTYFTSLSDPNSDFRFQNYYLTKDFTSHHLAEITDPKDGPEKKEALIQEILNWIEKFSGEKPSRGTEQMINNLVDGTLQKYIELNQNFGYYDGFNIYFGQLPLNYDSRSVLSIKAHYPNKNKNLTMLAYEDGDKDTQKHFNFRDLNEEDFFVKGNWHGEEAVFLRVNVSSRLANAYSLKTNSVLQMNLDGFNTARKDGLAYLIVDRVVKEETIDSMIYTSQNALMNYFANPDYLPFSDQTLASLPDKEKQKAVYQGLKAELMKNPKLISNTVFDRDNDVPWGMQNITLPFYNQNGNNLGQRAEDFYSDSLSLTYLSELGTNVVVFDMVSKRLSSSMWQVNTILNEFVIILLFLALILSLILITLVLLENRPVILLFKAIGYQKADINWYLISGYFVASILAMALGILISFIGLKNTQGIIAEYLKMSLYFVWSWEFILVALGLAGGFCALIAISVVVFTNFQKPREAFMVL